MRIDDFPDDAWICERHPGQPWPHPNPEEADGQYSGPGMLRAEPPTCEPGDFESHQGDEIAIISKDSDCPGMQSAADQRSVTQPSRNRQARHRFLPDPLSPSIGR